MENTRSISAEENLAPPFNRFCSIDGLTDQPPPQFECPICLNWLTKPVLTTCGHKFCKDCITAWLQQGGHCPVDNVSLRNVDIFPDNYTQREILQQTVVCPYASNGCTMKITPLEIENHSKICKYKRVLSTPSPKISKIPCSFKSLGCNVQFKNEEQLTIHLESNIQTHLNFLMAAYSKITIEKEVNSACENVTEEEAVNLWDPPEKTNNSVVPHSSNDVDLQPNMSMRGLIKALYERIVVLEQRNHEQDIAIGNLSRLITTVSNSQRQIVDDISLKYCFGTFVWKIENFTSKLDMLMNDQKKMLYSHGFYTSPTGYRFCARLNSSPVQLNFLSLHIHMMKSANDDCLEWPFTGKILFTLVNPTFPQLSQKDSMMTRPELAAFQKPTSDMSTRGFGFTTYISIDDLKLKGYISADILNILIKIE